MSIVLDGTTGITTPGLTNTGTETIVNLTTTGNTILGDASTDTLNVGNGGLVKDASGNVGIGTASPAQKLDVAGGAKSYSRIANGGPSNTAASTTWWYIGTIYMVDSQSATLRMDGGIGYGPTDKSSGSTYLHLRKDNSTGLIGYFYGTTFGTNGVISIAYKATATTYQFDLWIRIAEYASASVYCDTVGTYVPASTDTGTATQPAGSTLFTSVWTATTAGIERARIDSSGVLLLGATSNGAAGAKFTIYAATGQEVVLTGTSGTCIKFTNSQNLGGAISVASGGGTSYGTSSDYRLKHDIQPMTGALAKVAQLNPVTYKWNIDESESQGFIAHELQAVIPDAVVGEKDAVDSEGNPQYQNVDTSFLVATLTAAIQELKALVDTQASTITQLQADVEALKAQP